jgi:succinyl-CoA synthetase beta subunit
MLKSQIEERISSSQKDGWVLEPKAKWIMSQSGIDVPNFVWATGLEEAVQFAEEAGYPVVAKVVSPKVVHKSDVGGVVLGIDSESGLKETFDRFRSFEGFAGMLVEEMVSGVELIVGAKVDYQFGPVILVGNGGTGVEIYNDTKIRMAPLKERDAEAMISGLKAHRLIEGYRGAPPVNRHELVRTLLAFSDLVLALNGHFESIDLNPVMCTPERCIVADARIILKWGQSREPEGSLPQSLPSRI